MHSTEHSSEVGPPVLTHHGYRMREGSPVHLAEMLMWWHHGYRMPMREGIPVHLAEVLN